MQLKISYIQFIAFLNKIKKNITNKIIQTKKTKVDNSGIPPSTLKLIEEAENN